jgi:thiol-disulfide isomerase/thioredoxin
MNKHTTRNTIIVIAVIVVAVGFLFSLSNSGSRFAAGVLDDFAKCLSAKGATMYGAYWCPHCQNEKAAFGDSFRHVNYVECTEQTNKCVAANIQGYPTWVFQDGRRFEGEQGLQRLSEESGCPLPARQ